MNNRAAQHRFGPLGSAIGITVMFIVVEVFLALPFHEGRSAHAWPTATGTVASASMGRAGKRRKPTPLVTYTFQVDGATYSGSRYNAFPTGMSRERAEGILAQHTPGTTVTVYYNPANPSRSLLAPWGDEIEQFVWPFRGGWGLLTACAWFWYFRRRKS